MTDNASSGTEQCERCNDGEILGRVYVSADYDEAMTTKYRLCQDCIRSLGDWYRGTGMEQDDTSETGGMSDPSER